MFIELVNWKLDQLNRMSQKEKKVLESNIEEEEKQRVFEIMFKLDQSCDGDFDRIKSSKSSESSDSAAIMEKGKGKKYQKDTISERRKKVAATKFLLQDVLGKCVIPIGTAGLLIIYLVVVLAQCT